jgi:hypothetical protein
LQNSCKIEYHIVKESIRIGKVNQLVCFTKKVWDFQVGTEGKMQHHEALHKGIQITYDPGHQHQQSTELGIHDDCTVQRVTDGHKAVIGHHC